MSTLTHAIAELKDLAVEAQMSVDQFINAAVAIERREQAINASRRSSPESRGSIDAYMEGINGAINPDLSAGDICMYANVPNNRGNAQYAIRAKQRLLAKL